MIFLILFSLGSGSLHAATYTDTYWSYRATLTKNFVRLGDGPGSCLVADSRNSTTQTITFADTTSNQGWYLSVLATELHLLKQAKKDTTSNLREIACALQALNRLGLATGGYFIRDDVDETAADQFPGITNVVSDFTDPDPKKKQMSQDQALDLMMGYRFLAMYLNDQDKVGDLNLKNEVKRQVKTILDYMRGKPVLHSWVIYAKDGTKVARGPDAKLFSRAFMRIGGQILGLKGNRGIRSHFISDTAFLLLGITIEPLQFYSKTMALELAAVSDVWGPASQSVLRRYDLKYNAEIFRLINAVIYGRQVIEKEGGNKRHGFHDKVEGYLNLAPPSGIMGSDKPVWGQQNRYYADNRIRSQQYGPTDNPPLPTDEMPGTDFMLLHNLFLIYYSQN